MIDGTRSLSRDEPIPYDVFIHNRSELEAQRARRMEGIYHKGQERIWNGREVLEALIQRHGGVSVPADKRDALVYLLSLTMWGEYAAWRVASQLADRLNTLESRLAATSQAHDEARHFYVLHDYILAMGAEPVLPRFWGRKLIEATLQTHDINYKLMGMQLLIESCALGIFNNLRESRIEPVLADLMPYYERDEARHVGLGTQLLPETMAGSTPLYRARFAAYNTALYIWALNELKELEPDLDCLSIDPRRLADVVRDRMYLVFREMRAAGSRHKRFYVADAFGEGLHELYFPRFAPGRSIRGRVRGVGFAMWNGLKPADRRVDYVDRLRYEEGLESSLDA